MTIPDTGATNCNLITEYGMLTLENVRAHATGYIGMHTRNAQNTAQFYHCLSKSLTENAKKKVMLEWDSYIINGQLNGPAFLKVIITASHMDTRATVSHIQTNPTNLDDYLQSNGSNILKLLMILTKWHIYFLC